jgi:hypothetical protein
LSICAPSISVSRGLGDRGSAGSVRKDRPRMSRPTLWAHPWALCQLQRVATPRVGRTFGAAQQRPRPGAAAEHYER